MVEVFFKLRHSEADFCPRLFDCGSCFLNKKRKLNINLRSVKYEKICGQLIFNNIFYDSIVGMLWQ
jgi:hypothetical protein